MLAEMECSIVHQELTERLVSGATSRNQHTRIHAYFEAMHKDCITPPDGRASPLLGYHATYYQSTLGIYLRPPQTESWVTEGNLGLILNLDSASLPYHMLPLQQVKRDKNSKGEVIPVTPSPNPAASPSKQDSEDEASTRSSSS